LRATGAETYESLLIPGDALALVGVGIGVTVDGTSLASEETVQGRADLVAATALDSVALGAPRLEQVRALLDIACIFDMVSTLGASNS